MQYATTIVWIYIIYTCEVGVSVLFGSYSTVAGVVQLGTWRSTMERRTYLGKGSCLGCFPERMGMQLQQSLLTGISDLKHDPMARCR